MDFLAFFLWRFSLLFWGVSSFPSQEFVGLAEREVLWLTGGGSHVDLNRKSRDQLPDLKKIMAVMPSPPPPVFALQSQKF